MISTLQCEWGARKFWIIFFGQAVPAPPPNQLGLLCLYYFNEKNYNTIAQVICLLKIRDLSHDLLNTGIKVILFVNLANLTITQMNYISQSSECVIKHLILQSYH